MFGHAFKGDFITTFWFSHKPQIKQISWCESPIFVRLVYNQATLLPFLKHNAPLTESDKWQTRNVKVTNPGWHGKQLTIGAAKWSTLLSAVDVVKKRY